MKLYIQGFVLFKSSLCQMLWQETWWISILNNISNMVNNIFDALLQFSRELKLYDEIYRIFIYIILKYSDIFRNTTTRRVDRIIHYLYDISRAHKSVWVSTLLRIFIPQYAKCYFLNVLLQFYKCNQFCKKFIFVTKWFYYMRI